MTAYKIDAAHSEIQFKVKHLMITTVTGNFTKFEGVLESDKEDFTDGKISFSTDISSISTNNEQRDGHLKGPEFFDAEKFPVLKFESTSFTKAGDEEYKLEGNISIHGVTKSIKLDVNYGGAIIDPWGQSKIGFEITGKINRKDFGLVWNATTETGGIMLSEEVKLLLNVQLVKQA